MFNISQILDRVRSLRESNIGKRMVVKNTINKFVSIDIPVEQIEIKSSKVFVKNISQAAKSEIFLKKAAIIEEIAATLKNNRIKDIY
jgi:hypothetical protein